MKRRLKLRSADGERRVERELSRSRLVFAPVASTIVHGVVEASVTFCFEATSTLTVATRAGPSVVPG